MTDTPFYHRIEQELAQIHADGLAKPERIIHGPQSEEISAALAGHPADDVMNFCANNYLGLANHPDIIDAAKTAADAHGFGMASVRFICGTHALHKDLEAAISDYLGFADSITFAACFDANGAVFEPLFGAKDAIISDALNHASIIDGVRLCKARRYRFQNSDMNDLAAQLRQADIDGARSKLIVTDGVFSMDGYIANLQDICDLADQYNALVMVDDCHATGFLGEHGRGSPEYCGVEGRIDILTGTLGKALGGAMGGFICARKPIIDLLRQRARPYLFSNALAPAIAAGAIKAIELARTGHDLRARLQSNAKQFRSGMEQAGFTLLKGEHPIIPVMLGDARMAQTFAAALLNAGIFVTGFSYPVVPHGKARIRTQMSAAHTPDQIQQAVDTFSREGRALGVISSG